MSLLERAEAMSLRCSVRRLFSSAWIQARMVSSVMKMSQPLAKRMGASAEIIFTSGSTGKPKGVAVTHRSAAAFVDAEARLFCQDNPLGPDDRVLAGLSVAFDASCEEMWLAWGHGACLVPADVCVNPVAARQVFRAARRAPAVPRDLAEDECTSLSCPSRQEQ